MSSLSSAKPHCNQDWFMMTGDLIINLTNNKSQDMSYHKRNMRLKSAPSLQRPRHHQKQCNSDPNTPSNPSQGFNGDHNDGSNGYEDKQTQTNHKNKNDINYSNGDNDVIDGLVVKRQLSLPLVRFSKSDEQLLTTNHMTVVDINCSEECSNSLNTLLNDAKSWSQRSPEDDHRFNDDEEELLTHSLSNNSSSNDSQNLTISSANISPSKTLTMTAIETESSMSENYSLISSLSTQTLDQNRNKHSFKTHNNQTLSLSSSLSEDSTTPSSSPEEQQFVRNNCEDIVRLRGKQMVSNDVKDCVNGLNGFQVFESDMKTTNHSSVSKPPNNTCHSLSTQTMSGSDEESSDTESHYSPPKGVDTPSALRLAKRLYNLEGFTKSDVSRHLSKNNEFNAIVAEEYLKHFDFRGHSLDEALRVFLTRFCLIGETQERERVLIHFSKRFLELNPNEPFNSNDAIHTLTCALMLLNSDLHGENTGRKMTCNEFIHNLSGMNDGYDFPRDVLRILYQAIKESPLEWNHDENNENVSEGNDNSLTTMNLNKQISIIGHNPFLEVPNPISATEYKKGYVMRKSCYESDGKKTPMGRRGWKMFYATLRDLILYLHKDEMGFRKNQLYESLHNSIRVHHSLATNASDYTKKQFVFRLMTADKAEYLFQTSDSRELQSWIDTINYVSASLSAPPLPEAVGNKLRRFQRPLLPVSHTKLNLCEQLIENEKRVERLRSQLDEHLSKGVQKKSSKRFLNEFAEKESYFKHELNRYLIYVSALKTKLSQINCNSTPLLSSAPPLLSIAIGEETDEDLSDTPVIKNYSTDR